MSRCVEYNKGGDVLSQDPFNPAKSLQILLPNNNSIFSPIRRKNRLQNPHPWKARNE